MSKEETKYETVTGELTKKVLGTRKVGDKRCVYNRSSIQEEFCMQDTFDRFVPFMDRAFDQLKTVGVSWNGAWNDKAENMEDIRNEFRDRVRRIALSNAIKEEEKKYKTVVKNLLSAKNIILQSMAKQVAESVDKTTGRTSLSMAEQKSILEEIRKETGDIFDGSKGIEDESDALKDRLEKEGVI